MNRGKQPMVFRFRGILIAAISSLQDEESKFAKLNIFSFVAGKVHLY
jgi:hypothetical protein